VLAHIVQVDPIHVDFAPTERDRLDVLRGAAAGRLPADREGVPVEIILGDGTPYPHPGAIDYVDPTIEPTRGTVAVRALVPNPDAALKPGEFVRVVVVFPDVADAVLVPQRAVVDHQALRAGGEGRRRVESGASRRRLHDGMQQVTSGLTAGERVIVDGVQRRDWAEGGGEKEAAHRPRSPPELAAPLSRRHRARRRSECASRMRRTSSIVAGAACMPECGLRTISSESTPST
jgi:multidrug efflux pump subunit AcrA (membrane-fusion protein)